MLSNREVVLLIIEAMFDQGEWFYAADIPYKNASKRHNALASLVAASVLDRKPGAGSREWLYQYARR